MRNIRVFVMMITVVVLSVDAQVCNSASTIGSGRYSLGIAPVIYVGSRDNVGLYISGGIGLSRSLDLSLKMVLDDPNYFGADFEVEILGGVPTISLAVGMHSVRVVGIDGTVNITFPIRNVLGLYGGIDTDIDLYDNGTIIPVWGFFGFEARARRSMSLFMEINLGISDYAADMLAFGMNVYF